MNRKPYQRVTSDLNPPKVKQVRETCHAHPRIFEGMFADGDKFYCRTQWGMVTAYKIPEHRFAVEAYCIYRGVFDEDGIDEYVLYEDMRVMMRDACYLPPSYTAISGSETRS